MFIANLMASVLALAMVGASTASVSEFENNAVRSAENTTLVGTPKKAYYDPAGNYDDGVGYAYNYTGYSFTIELGEAGTPETITGDVPVLYSEGAYGFPTFGFVGSDDAMTFKFRFDGGAVKDGIDLYVDGDFVSTLSTDSVNGWFDEVEIPDLNLDDDSSNFYVWFFQHGTAPEPYTPVDILGDIAGGLTGGIVPVAEGIGSGLQSLVQDIFLNADHDGLSVFGIVIICFAGLALALGLSRWVLNFVDTMGARDR